MTHQVETGSAQSMAAEYDADTLSRLAMDARAHADELRRAAQERGGRRIKAARPFLRDADLFSQFAAYAAALADAAHAAQGTDAEAPFSWNDATDEDDADAL